MSGRRSRFKGAACRGAGAAVGAEPPFYVESNMDAKSIVHALKGRWCANYGMVRCPAHKDRTPSLKVADGAGDVVVHCFGGCSWQAVKGELRRQGLLPEWDGNATFDPKREAHRRDAAARAKKDEQKRTAWARSLWNEAQDSQVSPVSRYLKVRGITMPIPPTIRYHAALKHVGTGQLFPAMVASVTRWPSRKVIGVHRTFITPHGKKAPVSDCKKMAGVCAGGAVRLAAAGAELAITEGIETGLSIMQATGIPTWAALSVGSIKTLALPDTVREVIIGADGDDPGEGAAHEAALRWKREGRLVRIARPPRGCDFNDLLLNRKPHIEEDTT